MTGQSRKPRQRTLGGIPGHVPAEWAVIFSGIRIRRSQNPLITGATGSGKTWIACALAQQTCRQGHSVLYWRVPRLIEELRIAHGDGSDIKFLKTISKASLIVLDDWGLTALSAQDRADLLEILDDRVNTGSTLVDQSAAGGHVARLPR